MASQIEVIRATLKYSTQEELIQGMSPLITRRGLFIHTRMTKPVGSEVQFEFRLADGSKVYSGEGVVRKEVPFVGGPSSQKSGMLVALRRINRAFKEVVDAILGSTDADDSLMIAPDPEEAVKNQKIVQTRGGQGLDLFGDEDLDLGLDSLFSGIEKTPSRAKKPSGNFTHPNDDFFGQSSGINDFSFVDTEAKDDMPTPLPATFGVSSIDQNIVPDTPRATILTRSDHFAAVKRESQIRTGQFAAIKEIVNAERAAVKDQQPRTFIHPETNDEDLFPAPEMLDDIDDLMFDDLDTSAFAESLSEAFSSDEVHERLAPNMADAHTKPPAAACNDNTKPPAAFCADNTKPPAAACNDNTKPPAAACNENTKPPQNKKEKISYTSLNTPTGKIEAEESKVKEELAKITGDNPVLEEASLKEMTKLDPLEPEDPIRPFWGQRNRITDYESTLRKTSPYMTAISRNDPQSAAIRALHDRTAQILNQEKIKAAMAEKAQAAIPATAYPPSLILDTLPQDIALDGDDIPPAEHSEEADAIAEQIIAEHSEEADAIAEQIIAEHSEEAETSEALISEDHGEEAETSEALISEDHGEEAETSEAEISEDHGEEAETSEAKISEDHGEEAETSEAEISEDHGEEAETSEALISEDHGEEAETSEALISEDHGEEAETSEAKISEDHGEEAETSEAKISEDRSEEAEPKAAPIEDAHVEPARISNVSETVSHIQPPLGLPKPIAGLPKPPANLPKSIAGLPRPSANLPKPIAGAPKPIASIAEIASLPHPDHNSGTAIPNPEHAEPTTAAFPGNKDDTAFKDNQKEPDMNKHPSNSSFKIADEETPSQLFAALQEDMFSSIDSPTLEPEDVNTPEESEASAEEAIAAQPEEAPATLDIEERVPAEPEPEPAISGIESMPEPAESQEDEFILDMPSLDSARTEAPKDEEPVNDPFANASGIATLESMNGTSTPAVQRDSHDIVMNDVTANRQAVPRRRERTPEPTPPAPEPKKKGFFSKLFGR